MGISSNEKKEKLLLHSCCGPCSTAVIERLYPDYYVTVFYYNPCITDDEEYQRRKENQIKFIELFNKGKSEEDKISFVEGEYKPEDFFLLVQGYESEPEGGLRCPICFEQRLMGTAAKAKASGLDLFTTTLTVSPHKNYETISRIAKECAAKYDVRFLDMDFKKKAGFQRSVELAKEYELYRQDYCGCQFSMR